MRISFAKWFKVLREGDSYSDVIVGYQKQAVEWTFDATKSPNSVPSRYRRFLFINLWLIRIELSLETKVWK